MILILSEMSDSTTFSVIDWLEAYNVKYILITPNDKLDVHISMLDVTIIVKGIEIKFSEVKSYWYRRGYFNINYAKHLDENISQYQNVELNSKVSAF